MVGLAKQTYLRATQRQAEPAASLSLDLPLRSPRSAHSGGRSSRGGAKDHGGAWEGEEDYIDAGSPVILRRSNGTPTHRRNDHEQHEGPGEEERGQTIAVPLPADYVDSHVGLVARACDVINWAWGWYGYLVPSSR